MHRGIRCRTELLGVPGVGRHVVGREEHADVDAITIEPLKVLPVLMKSLTAIPERAADSFRLTAKEHGRGDSFEELRRPPLPRFSSTTGYDEDVGWWLGCALQ